LEEVTMARQLDDFSKQEVVLTVEYVLRQLDDFSKQEVVLTLEYVLRVMLDLAEPPPQGGGAFPQKPPP
jgi:hypothetical protein